MADIKYRWAKGLKSVGIDPSLELPQFRVVGHKQTEKMIPLSTGKQVEEEEEKEEGKKGTS